MAFHLQQHTYLHIGRARLSRTAPNSERPGFWTQFDVAVDSQDYSDIEKINLLYQRLVGKAKSRVAGIPRSAENYAVVKRILCDAYDRPDRLLKNLTEKLESLPVAKGTPSDLETFHVELESICRQLEGMGHDVNTLSTGLAVQKRLPPNLLQRWMETSGVDESMWTTNFLRAKLRQQVDIQESVGSYRQAAAPSTPRYDTAPRRYTTSRGITYVIEESTKHSDKSRLPPNPHPAPRRTFDCAFCGRDHFSAKCDIYSSLQQRIKRASDKGLCTRCLRGKHASTKCAVKLGPCRECSRRHHIALCDKRLSPSSAHPPGQPASKPIKAKKLTKRATFATVTDNEADGSDSDDYWRDNYLESDEDGSVSCDEQFDSIEQELEAATAIDDEIVEDDAVDNAHDVTAHNAPTTVAVKKAQKTESYLLAVASGDISKPNSSGRSEKVYILLDSCSSTTYISTEVATRLRLKQAPRRTYDVSVFGTTVPKSMTAADTTFDLHLPDGRRLRVSAEVVPHIVGHTATYDASDTDLDTLRHMSADFLPTKMVKPDILIGTKHLYKIGFVAERQCLRSGFTVVNTDLGPVVTGHGNMITNLKPVDSCNLVIHDAEF
ncbi:Pao retrotransposon peptidase family protein [Aphelenchoides avenae]|nr:Pao retrotransposon peptidase family protein [Aphelenchus avenae]